MSISAVVVLYNPTMNVMDNISSYINFVKKIYVIDNSDLINKKLINELKKIKKVTYHNNHGNKGIGYAYNYAAELALRENFQWLITMDQDSKCNKEMLDLISSYIDTTDTTQIGIVSPMHRVYPHQIIREKEVQEMMAVMSSGNFLNLEVYKKVGKYNNSYFIDQVDYEYCLKLNQHNYKVIMLGKAIMDHELGNVRRVNGVVYSIHSPQRIYYYVRNTLYLRKQFKNIYPDFISKRCLEVKNDVKLHIKLLGKKRIYIKYILKAFWDYVRNKNGKIEL